MYLVAMKRCFVYSINNISLLIFLTFDENILGVVLPVLLLHFLSTTFYIYLFLFVSFCPLLARMPMSAYLATSGIEGRAVYLLSNYMSFRGNYIYPNIPGLI